MKNILLLFITTILLFSCSKKIDEDTNAYLVFRDENSEVLLSEEVEVLDHTNKNFVIKTGSNDQVNYLKKSGGKYKGEIEVYRENSGHYLFEVELDAKAIGKNLMEGEFTARVDELWNGNFTGNQYNLSGNLEVKD